MSARVLVTGASGFVGRAVLQPLRARGFEVHGTARGGSPPEAAGCAWHRADLLDLRQRRALLDEVGPSHILHLAWYAVPGRYWTAPENTLWLEASLDLIALSHGMRVVMAGTCAEYDWSWNGIFRESDPCRPSTPYGQAKLAVRKALAAARGDSAWGIIFFPFGPHEAATRLVPSVASALLKGEMARCTHGAQVRDFLFVEDLGDAFAALLSSPLQGALNLASGVGRSIRSLVERLRAKLGGEIDFGALPSPSGDPPRLVADVRRLHEELGWSPPIGIEAGLDRTIAWCRCKDVTSSQSLASEQTAPSGVSPADRSRSLD